MERRKLHTKMYNEDINILNIHMSIWEYGFRFKIVSFYSTMTISQLFFKRECIENVWSILFTKTKKLLKSCDEII